MFSIETDAKNLIVDSEVFNYDVLKNAIERTLDSIDDDRLIRIIRVFPRVKPTIKFQTIYCLFDEFRGDKDLTQEFEIMHKYIHYDFDVFAFVNHLRRTKQKRDDKK